jgi:methionyl-tRNA formyltransferase
VRVVYLGTPAAAVPPLEALLASEHRVVAVVTRPDKPRDHRGGSPSPSPVKRVALQAGLPVLQPPVLAALPRGIINLHFSLLPAYRGAAPVQRALLDGVETTGICTFQIDEGMDTGPLLACREVPVLEGEDAGALTARLAEIGAGLVIQTLDGLQDGSIRPRPQPPDGSVAPKVDPAEARLDFHAPATRLVDAVRAFTPSPGAWTTFRGRRLKVARAVPARVGAGAGLPPGRVGLGPGGELLAGAGDGPVELVIVQPEGKRAMSGVEFARGARLPEEEWLGR